MATRAYHHGDLKRALLQASLELVEADGLEALTLRAVAQRLGVSHAAPVHHFPTRAHLLGALAEEGFGLFSTALEAAAAGRTKGRLLRVGRAYLAFASAHPQHYRILFGNQISTEAARTPGLLSASARALAVLHTAAGEHALLSWAVVHGLAQLRQGPYLCATDIEREALDVQIDQSLVIFTALVEQRAGAAASLSSMRTKETR